MSESPDHYEERFRTLRDEELARILRGAEGEYEPAAISAARRELGCRGITAGRLERLMEEVERAQAEEEARDAEPLPAGLRILCLVLPVPAGPPVALTQASRGLRRWKEAWAFTALGLVLWVLAAAVAGFVSPEAVAM